MNAELEESDDNNTGQQSEHKGSHEKMVSTNQNSFQFHDIDLFITQLAVDRELVRRPTSRSQIASGLKKQTRRSPHLETALIYFC